PPMAGTRLLVEYSGNDAQGSTLCGLDGCDAHQQLSGGFLMNPASPGPPAFQPDEAFALAMDASDPLRPYRDLFHIPQRPDGRPVIYFCGHSLGLQPKAVRAILEQELEDWARLGVEAHFRGRSPWYSYHELFRESAARLVGALPGEVVMMNSLTVNLHLMMTTFYRPERRRWRIVIDEPAFPSDLYAVQSQIRCRGLDP